MADFFQMGGYAIYIWPPYLLSFAVLGFIFQRRWARLRQLRALESAAEKQPPEGDNEPVKVSS